MLNAFKLCPHKRGRLSVLRIVTLVVLFVPVAIAAWIYATTGFGARPLNDLIHRTGYWGLIFLLMYLAVTPMQSHEPVTFHGAQRSRQVGRRSPGLVGEVLEGLRSSFGDQVQ